MNRTNLFARLGVVCALCLLMGQTAVAQSLQEGLKMMSYEKYPQAVAALEAANKSMPADVDVLYQLGNAYLLSGEANKAKETYAKIILSNPKSLLGNIGAAKIAMAEGNTADASKLLEGALKSSKGKDVNILRYIGEAYLVGKKPNADAAITALTKAVALGQKRCLSQSDTRRRLLSQK
ncbi:MAG: tetratricopeptide repeat protein [Sphingobacteriales bacterium]|nr:tetratricopeptide repeat protein [Sphingobacteriales bacterium]